VPTYDYACTACQHRFEVVQAFTDDSLTECPECQGRLRKLFGSVGVVFKGSGFYRTDSRADSKPCRLVRRRVGWLSRLGGLQWLGDGIHSLDISRVDIFGVDIIRVDPVLPLGVVGRVEECGLVGLEDLSLPRPRAARRSPRRTSRSTQAHHCPHLAAR
jgi:putative FmdB family regulatory protein